MKVKIFGVPVEGDSKEIAALVLVIQERQEGGRVHLKSAKEIETEYAEIMKKLDGNERGMNTMEKQASEPKRRGLSEEQINHQKKLVETSKKIASLLVESQADLCEVDWTLKNARLFLRVAER